MGKAANTGNEDDGAAGRMNNPYRKPIPGSSSTTTNIHGATVDVPTTEDDTKAAEPIERCSRNKNEEEHNINEEEEDDDELEETQTVLKAAASYAGMMIQKNYNNSNRKNPQPLPSPSSSAAIAKELPDASLRAEEDESSVEQVLVKASEDMMEAKAGNENEEENECVAGEDAKAGNENDSGFVPEQQNSSKNLNPSQSRKASLSESQSRTSSATSQTAAFSDVPGAYRVASSSTRSSSIEIEANESSDFSNTTETNENSGITTAETADVDVDADVEATAGGGGAATENHPVSTAYLVQDKLAEVVEIKPFYQRKEGRRTIALVTFLLVAMAVLLGVFLTLARRRKQDAELDEQQLDEQLVPSMSPSQAPTFDPRPTLQVVQDRGVVKCGIEDVDEGGDEKFGKYQMDFCRGLAAVLFGDPARFSPVSVGDDRYEKLLRREVDVLFAGDTFTLEKAIKEPTTGSALAFGHPFYTAAVVYAGPDTYVQCASNQKRSDECQDLSICAVDTPDLVLLLPQYFPASFIIFEPFPIMEEYLKDGTCNVIVSDTYRLSSSSLQQYIDNGTFVISDYHISRNLLSSVVRVGDFEWYDIVDAARLSRFRATQMGIHQNISACNENAKQPSSIETIEAKNSVSIYKSSICVGNSVEIFQRSLGETVISFDTFLSAIDAPTFGSLECSDCADVLNSGKLKTIRERGHLNCAVYLDPVHNLTRSSLATLMNDKFCQLLGVVIFQGDPDATNTTYIDNLDYRVFPREYDVVAGAGWEGKMGNTWDPTNAGSMSFSSPYFIHDKYRYNGKIYDGLGLHMSYAIDNEDHSLLALSTAVIIATVYAQRQGIIKATHSDMPLIYLFGDSLTFMLRDLIAYGGNYDEIINEAFANSDGATEIGWNTVIPNWAFAAKTPVLYCDFTGHCPPCQWIDVNGYQVCVWFGAY